MHRRSFLAAGCLGLLAGCTGSGSELSVRLVNDDAEPHYLHVVVAGRDSDEPVLEHAAYLEPDPDLPYESVSFSRDALEGPPFVRVRVDHGEQHSYSFSGGSGAVSVWIEEDDSVSFEQDVY